MVQNQYAVVEKHMSISCALITVYIYKNHRSVHSRGTVAVLPSTKRQQPSAKAAASDAKAGRTASKQGEGSA